MEISVYVASAFSKYGKGGNKAGVVLGERELTTIQKMEVARQLGYAETTFISESKLADYKIEYFTPKEEVDLCGHATIGSFCILRHLGKLSKTTYTIETKSGILKVTIDDDIIFMEQNKPSFYDILDKNRLENCFDVQKVDDTYEIQIVSTGLRDILVSIKSDLDLQDLKVDFEEIKKISENYDVIGMHLYSFDENRIICRNFAPLYDIDEEPATGTSNGALASYLYKKHGLKKDIYIFDQGYSMNSPSEIMIKLGIDGEDEIEKVYVGGRAYYSETRSLTI